MATRIRESQGGAFESRGKFFIHITDRPQHRTGEHAPWATSLDEARKRAHVVQAWVNRLREAGETDFIGKIIELGAAADEAMLVRLADKVDAITGGNFERVASTKGPSELSTQTEAWLASVASLYDRRTHDTLTQYASKWPDLFGATVDAMNDSPALARWLSKRLGQVTRSTVLKETWGMRAFLTWSADVAKTIDAVATFPKLPKRATGVRVGPQRKDPVPLTREQIDALLAAMSAKALPRYTFMDETGLRPETIDEISVPEHYTKGSTTLEITDDIDKARFGRTLPLSPKAREVLDAILATRMEPGPIFGRSRLVKHFKAAVAACGLPPETAPYDLRHARGTHGVEASGGNLNGVAYLLGHKQVTTTNKYVHSSQRSAETVLSALDCCRVQGSNAAAENRANPPSLGEIPSDSEGVTDGVRTRDTWSHNPVLYQLSYGHRETGVNIPATAVLSSTNRRRAHARRGSLLCFSGHPGPISPAAGRRPFEPPSCRHPTDDQAFLAARAARSTPSSSGERPRSAARPNAMPSIALRRPASSATRS